MSRLPYGVHLRIWRWVANSLVVALGFGALLVTLPVLGASRFLMLSFLIPGVGYTLSGLLFLRRTCHRVQGLTASKHEEGSL